MGVGDRRGRVGKRTSGKMVIGGGCSMDKVGWDGPRDF